MKRFRELRPEYVLTLLAVIAVSAGWWNNAAPLGEPAVPWGTAVPALAQPTGGSAASQTAKTHSVGVAWFFQPETGAMVPVALRLPRPVSEPELATSVYGALCSGPPAPARQNGGLSTAIGPCRVTNAWIQNGTLHVQFAPEQVPAAAGLAADQMALTAAQFAGIKQLQLWAGPLQLSPAIAVNGRPAHTLP